jgi:hypothetical protein
VSIKNSGGYQLLFVATHREPVHIGVVDTPLTEMISMSDKDNLLVYDVPEAGAKLGLCRGRSYEAAKRGDIPTIRIGRLLKVPKAAFEKMLNVTVKKTEAA